MWETMQLLLAMLTRAGKLSGLQIGGEYLDRYVKSVGGDAISSCWGLGQHGQSR